MSQYIKVSSYVKMSEVKSFGVRVFLGLPNATLWFWHEHFSCGSFSLLIHNTSTLFFFVSWTNLLNQFLLVQHKHIHMPCNFDAKRQKVLVSTFRLHNSNVFVWLIGSGGGNIGYVLIRNQLRAISNIDRPKYTTSTA